MKKKLSLLSVLIFTIFSGMMLSESSNVDAANTAGEITYQAHVERNNWQNFVRNGQTAGTTGKGLRLEALKIKLANVQGFVEYSGHVQNIGWQNLVGDGRVAGTTGRGLRLEAFKVRLAGEVATQYDVYYRAHVQNIGWQSWRKNDEVAGTTGQGLQVEALEVKLVAKAGATNGAKVVDVAQNQIGVPYVWAGTTRAGFDCSGLTQYVYKHALGKNIGRVTTEQEKSGTVVSLNDAKPGDLVFWGSRGSTYHTGIYIGNGNYIHSPQPGQKVKIGKVAWFRPNFAVRVR